VPVLFDSSLYIEALRNGSESLLAKRWILESPIWLSSVVLEELFAGADPNDHRVLERLEHDFEKASRILVPNLSDWTSAGRVLYRLARKYGFERIGKARLSNDALIATSAARMGIVVLTANQRDYEKLAEFCPLQWRREANSGSQ
jgi:predicted nucleic acid-binding protein